LPRNDQRFLVDALQTVTKSRPVAFEQDGSVGLNDIVGTDPDDVVVEGTVMQGAHGDSVWNNRFTAFAVLFDVCRIEEFGVSKIAEGTPPSVGREYSLAKDALMHTSLHDGSRVLAPNGRVGWVSTEISLLRPAVSQA
jgi:hypothetical protein